MISRKVTLPYGNKNLAIRVPGRNLIGVCSPREVAPVGDVRAEVRRAVAAPIGAPPLREQVRGRKNVVLIADDNTRLTTAYTHMLVVRAPRSYLGLLDNPVREELDAMARKVGMHAILNTVLNREGKVGRNAKVTAS